MLGEVHAEPQIRRAVEAGQESIDDGARQQLEIPDPTQDGRVEELSARGGVAGTRGSQVGFLHS